MLEDKNQNLLDKIIEPVINLLKNEIVPWRITPKPYMGSAKNYKKDEEYKGINWVLLNLVYRHYYPWYLTQNQIQLSSGEVKEDSTSILCCSLQSGNLQLQRLFNIISIKDVKFEIPFTYSDKLVGNESEFNELLNQMNKFSGFQIFTEGKEGASWSVGDTIDLPFRDWYDDYTAVDYHRIYTKIIHWTGHEDRLARDAIVHKFNTESFAFSQEHLVGEIGTAYLCMMVGLDRNELIETPPEYIYKWIKLLEQDSGLLYRASKQAFEAIQYIFK